jgi:hypothetical protein
MVRLTKAMLNGTRKGEANSAETWDTFSTSLLMFTPVYVSFRWDYPLNYRKRATGTLHYSRLSVEYSASERCKYA